MRWLTAMGLIAALALPAAARESLERPPWRERAAGIQAAFRADPAAFPRFSLDPPPTPVTSANERWAVDGLLLTWDCESSPGNPDSWDRMWLALIDGAWDAVDLTIYIGGGGHSDASDVDRCQQMLQQNTGRDPNGAMWFNEDDDHELDSIWIRDYGPFFVLDEASEIAVVDAHYVRYNRDDDDAQPAHFAGWLGVPLHDWDFATEGGNFLPNGHGLCIASETIYALNPQYSPEEIEIHYDLFLGCDELIVVPALDPVTGHADMWITWLDHRTLVVAEYDPGDDPIGHQLIENAVTGVLSGLTDPSTGETIEILRIPQPDNDNRSVWRNYTNGIWIDDTFLMPSYQGFEHLEAEATAVLAAHGVTVVPIGADVIIPSAGAFHCISKTLPSPDGLVGDDDDSGDDDSGDDDTGDDDLADDDDDGGGGDDDDLRAGGEGCDCRTSGRSNGPVGALILVVLFARRVTRKSTP